LADWTEIDLKAKVWTIPGPRRKGKKGAERPLAVPLSDRCREILSATEKRTGPAWLKQDKAKIEWLTFKSIISSVPTDHHSQ
jgi:hypothetical protein